MFSFSVNETQNVCVCVFVDGRIVPSIYMYVRPLFDATLCPLKIRIRSYEQKPFFLSLLHSQQLSDRIVVLIHAYTPKRANMLEKKK